MTVQDTLSERGSRYGDFTTHAEISRTLQDIFMARPSWAKMRPFQQQGLIILCDKLARIANGDPDYIDNWHDIQGYAKLVEDRLQVLEDQREKVGASISDLIKDSLLTGFEIPKHFACGGHVQSTGRIYRMGEAGPEAVIPFEPCLDTTARHGSIKIKGERAETTREVTLHNPPEDLHDLLSKGAKLVTEDGREYAVKVTRNDDN